jgi:hypothetical protein
VRLAPLDVARARAAILDSGWAALLGGVRGQPPRDVDALADVVHRVSRLIEAYAVESLDLNPVMVMTEGSGVRIADFRIVA